MRRTARGILVTPQGTLMLLRRVRHDRPIYWTVPGGGIEETDNSPYAALVREIAEETGSTIDRYQFAFYNTFTRYDGTVQEDLYYVCRVAQIAWENRYGEEFNDPLRGEYYLDEINWDQLSTLNILPQQLKRYLIEQRLYILASILAQDR